MGTATGRPDVVIVGPGAMGCGVAACLAENGARVALLDHRPERARALTESGITATLGGEARTYPVRVAASAEELGLARLVIVLVKAYSTERAAENLEGCVGPQTAVLTIQNGLGNYETLAERIDRRQVFAGTIMMGCATTGPGEVLISGVGQISLGSPFGQHEKARAIGQMLQKWWRQVAVIEDIDSAIWHKAIINAAVNPLTALTGLRNGELLEDELLLRTLCDVAEEGDRVATCWGLRAFPHQSASEAVAGICELTAQNRSSMLQDVSAGRPTEIDQINGEMLRRAEAKGVCTPHLQTLTALVKGRERGYSTPNSGGRRRASGERTANRRKGKTD